MLLSKNFYSINKVNNSFHKYRHQFTKKDVKVVGNSINLNFFINWYVRNSTLDLKNLKMYSYKHKFNKPWRYSLHKKFVYKSITPRLKRRLSSPIKVRPYLWLSNYKQDRIEDKYSLLQNKLNLNTQLYNLSRLKRGKRLFNKKPRKYNYLLTKSTSQNNSIFVAKPYTSKLVDLVLGNSDHINLPFYKNSTICFGTKLLYKPFSFRSTRLKNILGFEGLRLNFQEVYNNNLYVGGIKFSPSTSFKGIRILGSSKASQPFILFNNGYLTSIKLSGNNLDIRHKSNFKKLIYSFLYPNQYKKNIFLRKKKYFIARFITSYGFRKSKSLYFSYKSLMSKFTEFFGNKLNSLGKQLNFSLNSSVPSSHKFTNYIKSNNNVMYSQDFLSRGIDNSSKLREVFIPRVRFKPGYQRLWRLARLSIKEHLNLKYKYQYRLTRYLCRFSRFTSNNFFYFNENTLDKVILYSKLLPDSKSFYLFLNKNMIYLNGYGTKSNSIVYVNDVVQVIVSKWYYIFYRWMSNWTNIRVKKFRRMVFRKSLSTKKRLMKYKKTRSNKTPNWIVNTKFDSFDIKNYLEVDYFTLSSVVIYEPYVMDNSYFMDLLDNKSSIFRMHNWKYIT